jgi:hypothetical protein
MTCKGTIVGYPRKCTDGQRDVAKKRPSDILTEEQRGVAKEPHSELPIFGRGIYVVDSRNVRSYASGVEWVRKNFEAEVFASLNSVLEFCA